MDTNLSAADIMALKGDDRNDTWAQNPFIYLIYLWIFRMFNGNGFGSDAATQGALTRAELQDGLNNQTTVNKLDEISGSLCNQFATVNSNLSNGFANLNSNLNSGFNSITNGLCQGFSTTNSNMLQGFNGIDKSIYMGNAAIAQQLADNRYAQQQCCCENKQLIAGLSAENYQNTCAITNAIHQEGETTRALINSNTMQDLRDKLADRDRDLQTANFRISQYAQNDILINALQDKTPVPAYLTSSPYTSIPVSYIGANGCSSCGNNY